MYVVRRLGSQGWQENYQTLEDRKNCQCYISIKIQKSNFVFSKWRFFLSFLSLYFFSVYYFSFALLTIIMRTKWQSKRINMTSNINKLITISSWQNKDNLHKKMKFSMKDFSSKCDQIHRKHVIWTHLLEKSLMENFIFCAVIRCHIGFFERLFNLELSSHSFHKITFASFCYLYSHKT